MTAKMERTFFEMGSEYDWDSNKPYILEAAKHVLYDVPEDRIKYLRSGRDAIRYAARLHKDSYATVLMPALSCACMSAPFEDEGYNVVFYRLNPDLSIDLDDVRMKIKKNSIFLYMNYFGQPSFCSDDLKDTINCVNNILTIEDITHDFLSRTADSLEAYYTVCSIRKWFAIPDGGVLLSKKPIREIPLDKDSYFADVRIDGLKHKSCYLHNRIRKEKEYYREAFRKANAYIDRTDNIASMDDKSEGLLQCMNLKKMYAQRCGNTEFLHNELKDIPCIHSMLNNSIRSTLYYPILTEVNQLTLQKKLSEKGLYLPVIWPLSENAKGICSVADYISTHMLAFPCDHRYAIDDIKYAIDIVRDRIGQ